MTGRFLNRIGVRGRIIDYPGLLLHETDPVYPPVRHVSQERQGIFPRHLAGGPSRLAERCRIEKPLLVQFADETVGAACQLLGHFKAYQRHILFGFTVDALSENPDYCLKETDLSPDQLIRL